MSYLFLLVHLIESYDDEVIIQYFLMATMDKILHDELIRKWTFVGFAGFCDSEYKPKNVREMTIDFRENNKVTGRSSCIAFGGDYSIRENNSISMHHLEHTFIYFGDNIIRYWNDKYLSGLENAVSYEITGNRLIINTDSGVKMIFSTI